MEFLQELKPDTVFIANQIEIKRSELRELISQYSLSDTIAQAVLDYQLAKYKLEKGYGGTSEHDAAERVYNEMLQGIDLHVVREIKNLESLIYYEKRAGRIAAINWPINYMDVCVPGAADTNYLAYSINSRDVFVKRAARSDPNQYRNINALRIGPEANSIDLFIKRAAGNLLKNIPIDNSAATHFVFTSKRRITRDRSLPLLHPTNIRYSCFNWDACDRVRTDQLVDKIIYLNYKISKWIMYDIYLEILKQRRTGSLEFYFADDSVESISWFFTQAGPYLCERNVRFSFIMEDDARAGYHPRSFFPPADILSAQAFYFKYYHEIWRNDPLLDAKDIPCCMAKTPNSVYVDPKCQLYDDLVALQEIATSQFDIHDVKIAPPPEEEFAEAESDNPTFTIVVAGPGSGKSTYLRDGCRGALKVNYDDIFLRAECGGKSTSQMKQERFDEISKLSEKIKEYPNLGNVILNTLHYTIHHQLDKQLAAKIIEEQQRLRYNYFRTHNICLESVGGGGVNKFDLRSGAALQDSCGIITKSPNSQRIFENSKLYDICFGQNANCRVVYLVIDFKKQYYQDLYRSLREKRIIRYYDLVKFNTQILLGPNDLWRSRMNVIALVDADTSGEVVMRDGVIQEDAVKKHAKFYGPYITAVMADFKNPQE